MSRQMFSLTKWYLDVVDPSGRCAIGYSTELLWGPAGVRWEALWLRQPGVPPIHRWAVGRAEPPDRRSPVRPATPGAIEWQSPALGYNLSCEPWTWPVAERLYESAEGAVDWTCEAPAATVRLTSDRVGVAGAGYVECLTLTLPPWRLPISELRWGRWSCAATRRSLVWIEWRGAHPLTLVLQDGRRADDGRVDDHRVRAGACELVFEDTTVLYADRLGDTAGLGALAGRLPRRWRDLEDRKSLSIGRSGNDSGWVIHETVRFP